MILVFCILQVPPWPEIWTHESRSRRQSQSSVSSVTSSGNGNLPLTLASPSNAVLICDDAAYNAVDRVNNYVLMDKSILKVHLPNGGFNVVKCGDATDIRVISSLHFVVLWSSHTKRKRT